MSEAPERIWVWGWRADSVWQEQTWQHEDEPMSTMEYVRVDLVEAAEQRGYANAMEAERKLHEARIEELEAKLAMAVEAGVDVAASLSAAISLLQRGGKKAAPSDKMFNQMLADYNASLDRLRTTLAEPTGDKDAKSDM